MLESLYYETNVFHMSWLALFCRLRVLSLLTLEPQDKTQEIKAH